MLMFYVLSRKWSQEAWPLSSLADGRDHLKIAAFDFGTVSVIGGQVGD